MTIMPPYLPLHLELVYLSGLCEAALGVLLVVPRFSRLAAWGICVLLIAVFPANISGPADSRIGIVKKLRPIYQFLRIEL